MYSDARLAILLQVNNARNNHTQLRSIDDTDVSAEDSLLLERVKAYRTKKKMLLLHDYESCENCCVSMATHAKMRWILI